MNSAVSAFTATYAAAPDAMVYSSGSAVRKDASGPGTWAFLPARLPSGEIVVIDAGFVENTMQERSVEDRAVKKLVTGAPVALTGYLRFPEAARMADAGREPRQAAVVRARSSGDRKRARLGRRLRRSTSISSSPRPRTTFHVRGRWT